MSRNASKIAGPCLAIASAALGADFPEEQLLWPNGIENNPIVYEESNIMREEAFNPQAPSGSCRVYSHVAEPTFFIYRPTPEKNTGVSLVVLPGGGYRDIWLDKEGHDIGLYYQELGITSLVVKYRTNSQVEGKERMSLETYLPNAIADAAEGIRILRHQAEDLNIDPKKIGLGGFSAGGHLAIALCLADLGDDAQPAFSFLIYPWIQEGLDFEILKSRPFPPSFIVVGQPDKLTPVDGCLLFYGELCENKVPAELHVYGKGDHGFSLAHGTGHSTEKWPSTFIDWLRDMEMIESGPGKG